LDDGTGVELVPLTCVGDFNESSRLDNDIDYSRLATAHHFYGSNLRPLACEANSYCDYSLNLPK